MGLLLLKEPGRVTRQFEYPDALFEVGLVRTLVLLDLPLAAVLLGAPLCRHPVEEGRIDPPVELVNIHGVDAVLEPVVFSLQAGDCLVVVAFLVAVALPESLTHPVEYILVESQLPEDLGELLFQHLLAHVGLAAFPLVASAVVVDVPLLFDLADDGAATVTALDQAGEGEVVLGSAVPLGVTSIKNALHMLPQLARNDRLMDALI